MFLKIRCPVCGMQVSPHLIRARPVVAVAVTSRGRGGIQNEVIDAPVDLLVRIKDVLETVCKHISNYDLYKEFLPSLIQKLDLCLEPNYIQQPKLIERR